MASENLKLKSATGLILFTMMACTYAMQPAHLEIPDSRGNRIILPMPASREDIFKQLHFIQNGGMAIEYKFQKNRAGEYRYGGQKMIPAETLAKDHCSYSFLEDLSHNLVECLRGFHKDDKSVVFIICRLSRKGRHRRHKLNKKRKKRVKKESRPEKIARFMDPNENVSKRARKFRKVCNPRRKSFIDSSRDSVVLHPVLGDGYTEKDGVWRTEGRRISFSANAEVDEVPDRYKKSQFHTKNKSRKKKKKHKKQTQRMFMNDDIFENTLEHTQTNFEQGRYDYDGPENNVIDTAGPGAELNNISYSQTSESESEASDNELETLDSPPSVRITDHDLIDPVFQQQIEEPQRKLEAVNSGGEIGLSQAELKFNTVKCSKPFPVPKTADQNKTCMVEQRLWDGLARQLKLEDITTLDTEEFRELASVVANTIRRQLKSISDNETLTKTDIDKLKHMIRKFQEDGAKLGGYMHHRIGDCRAKETQPYVEEFKKRYRDLQKLLDLQWNFRQWETEKDDIYKNIKKMCCRFLKAVLNLSTTDARIWGQMQHNKLVENLKNIHQSVNEECQAEEERQATKITWKDNIATVVDPKSRRRNDTNEGYIKKLGPFIKTELPTVLETNEPDFFPELPEPEEGGNAI